MGLATDLAEGHTLLEQQGCDATIVDLNLNGTMAHPLIAALRGRGVPVVVATGYGNYARDSAELPPGCLMLPKSYAIQLVYVIQRKNFKV